MQGTGRREGLQPRSLTVISEEHRGPKPLRFLPFLIRLPGPALSELQRVPNAKQWWVAHWPLSLLATSLLPTATSEATRAPRDGVTANSVVTTSSRRAALLDGT